MPAADHPTANCQTPNCHRHIAKHETSKPNQQAPDREPPNDHIMPTANRPTPNRQPQPPTGQLPTTNRLRAKGDNSGFRVRVLNSTPRATLDHEICTTKNYLPNKKKVWPDLLFSLKTRTSAGSVSELSQGSLASAFGSRLALRLALQKRAFGERS